MRKIFGDKPAGKIVILSLALAMFVGMSSFAFLLKGPPIIPFATNCKYGCPVHQRCVNHNCDACGSNCCGVSCPGCGTNSCSAPAGQCNCGTGYTVCYQYPQCKDSSCPGYTTD